jgi:hypothetical protein
MLPELSSHHASQEMLHNKSEKRSKYADKSSAGGSIDPNGLLKSTESGLPS